MQKISRPASYTGAMGQQQETAWFRLLVRAAVP